MPEPDSISGDIIAAGTFLAGLILVYIGNLNSSFGSYTTEQQSDVRGDFKTKAWMSFWAFAVSLASVALALGSAWFDNAWMLMWSVILLLFVFLGGIVSAFLLVKEIG